MIKELSKEKIRELEWRNVPPGSIRHKAIRTIIRRRGVSYEKAIIIQAKAIARNG